MATQGRRRNMATPSGIKYGYRSGLEDKVSKQLKESGVTFEYETLKIVYEVNETRKYTPDFIFPNGMIVETKGRFVSADRKKHLLIQKQHPHLDIRFVFSNSKAKLNKGAKSTYGQWCDKHGFLYADKEIPEDWINEATAPSKRKPSRKS
jgi:hypothetical protein